FVDDRVVLCTRRERYRVERDGEGILPGPELWWLWVEDDGARTEVVLTRPTDGVERSPLERDRARRGRQQPRQHRVSDQRLLDVAVAAPVVELHHTGCERRSPCPCF